MISRHFAAFGAALSIAACTAPPPPAPVSYRDTTRLIGAAALFDFNDMAGMWEVLAHYPLSSSPCGAMAMQFAGGQVQLLCRDDPAGLRLIRQGPVQAGGTGRILLDLGPDFEARDLRVIWIAHDRETVVLGAADGRAGFVLHRSGAMSADRWAAVREMLDFNGFDLGRLQRR